MKNKRRNIVDNQKEKNDYEIKIANLSLIKQYAEFAYEQEIRREESIKKQACSMQAAFSFMIAAISMVIPVIVEHRSILSNDYLFLVFSSIIFLLVLSLLFSTFSLKLIRNKFCTTISDQKEYIIDNYRSFEDEDSRLDYIINYYDELQQSLRKTSELRIKFLNASRIAFVTSLFLSIFWFIVSLIMLTFF